MTSYMVEYLWRHINLKLHQLGYLYVTWPKSRDVISVRYHVMKLITPENPGNELASFLEKKIQTRLGTSGSVISGKNYPFQLSHFNYFDEFFEKNEFWEMSKRHSWKKNPNLFLSLDVFSRDDAYSFPEKYFFHKFMIIYTGKKSGYFFQKWRLLISQKAIFGILAGFFFQEWRLLISRLLDFFPRFADRG